MASGQTANYGLNQWEPGDKVLREEFNGDNQKIDAALGTIPRIVTGTYTGDGAASRFLNLGFAPRALYVSAREGMSYASSGGCHYGGLVLPGHPVSISGYTVLRLEGNGVWVYFQRTDYYTILSNKQDQPYYYIAVV